MTGEEASDGGVAHGALLIRFADAVVAGDEVALRDIRQEIATKISVEAVGDTAAVAALFNAIDRVADATGIEMEDTKTEDSADFRAEIGVNDFFAADQKGRA